MGRWAIVWPMCACALLLGTVGCSDAAAGATAAADQSSRSGVTAPVTAPAPRAEDAATAHLVAWLDGTACATDGAVRGLCYAYFDASTQKPWFLSTMVSAEVARFRLALGQVERAREAADALLAWRNPGGGPVGERLIGAFPSEIAPDASDPRGWSARYLYDTGDNFAVCEALLSVYEATGDHKYLDGARDVGVWMRDVMSHGERFGVWLEPLGAPMQAVTSSGDFDNRVPVGRTLFWLPTLRRLSRLTGDDSFAALAQSAATFLAKGIAPSGAPSDHYDPGWPPVAFDPARFAPYETAAVVADDSLRAALGLAAEGDVATASRIASWIQHAPGRIPGYLDAQTGDAYFPPGNVPYDDVISSSLYAALGQRLGGRADGDEAAHFGRDAQTADGGFWWGRRADDGAPISSDESTLTGLWALLDMSPQR